MNLFIKPKGAANYYKHGHRPKGTPSPEYQAWCAMRNRCLNPNVFGYDRYGGRGIKVCERWRTFENFLADMGLRPEGRTLDRKDNDGNYEPGNCRWATLSEQQNNRSVNHRLTLHGETLTATEWARRVPMNVAVIYERLKRGWSVERAVTTPPRKVAGK